MASEPKPDADRIREQQRQQWDGAASGWQEWSDTIDTGGSPRRRGLPEVDMPDPSA